jgi:hypothetical protein
MDKQSLRFLETVQPELQKDFWMQVRPFLNSVGDVAFAMMIAPLINELLASNQGDVPIPYIRELEVHIANLIARSQGVSKDG